jgi:hypothetical protein
LVQDKPNTFGSFPESNHASSALQFVNNCLLKERTQQYPEHVKHYGGSSPIWPTRTEKGEAHQLVWPQEVVKKTYRINLILLALFLNLIMLLLHFSL